MGQDLNLDYGFKRLETVPLEMERWDVWLLESDATNYGEYVLIGLEPADQEGAHQVIVLDENGHPLNGIWVIFGFPGGGPSIPLSPRRSYWRDAPRVLRGNWVSTRGGYAEHTFQQGGEDIWVHDLNPERELRYSSVIVKNCKWIQDRFNHTGVKITFQRRDSAVVPDRIHLRRLTEQNDFLSGQYQVLLQRLQRLEQALDDLTPGSLGDLMGRPE